eukprot:TRINITY_DN18_c0_g1_i1.p1 TRINITY_DN18_c0_g1~~TRINITY_DN18_c0_g1_i1.p1  ORF type:complete len:414 (+),score=45.96 TRINITY_DN18_c0_g1_i1:323-1564(+)
MKRKIKLTAVEAVTKSTVASNFEFVLHVPSEYDYRYVGELQEEIVQVLKEVYLQNTGKNLPIYGVPGQNLKEFVTSKSDRKKNICKVPEEKFRLVSENLITEASLKSTGNDDSLDLKSIKGKLVYYRTKGGEDTALTDFKVAKFLNKSAYERNYVIEHTPSKKLFTMKEIRKDSLLDTSKITQSKFEVEAAKCDHPFLATPEFVFQASTGIYFLFEFMRGGDLLQLLGKYKRLPESQAQFYIAQLILALTHLHNNRIVFRELRPENVQFDSKGYIRINAFSIHQFLDDEKKRQRIITAEANSPQQQRYTAPEIITGEAITNAMDWWALGVILYEMLVGVPPFFSQNQHTLKQHISSKEVKYPDPINYHILVSDAAKEIISKVGFLKEQHNPIAIDEEQEGTTRNWARRWRKSV